MLDKKWRKIYFALDLSLEGLKMVYIVFSNPLTHTTFKSIVFTFLKCLVFFKLCIPSDQIMSQNAPGHTAT